MADDPNASTEKFLLHSLEKILAEKDVKKSANAPLREACQQALDSLKNELKHKGASTAKVDPNRPLPPPGASGMRVSSEKYFKPFKMACESRSPKVVRTALDSLQKLMAYGHITGTMYAELEGLPDAQRLVDSLVETVCNCFTNETTDEGVQLQILKALLTAVTSTTCVVHERTLLRAVRTCYNIYLTSKNLVNQTTAKATLTQMISVIFQRMESVAQPQDQIEEEAMTEDAALEEEQRQQQQEEEAEEEEADEDEGGGDGGETGGPVQIAAQQEEDDTQHQQQQSSDDEHGDDGNDGGASVVPLETFAATLARSLLSSAIADVTGSPAATAAPTSPEVQQQQQQQQQEIEMREEDLTDEQYGHVYRKDAFLVFRSMCKLSMKDLADEEADPRSHELRSKILSLELQLVILQNAGPAFCNDSLFIDGIKQYLCVALSKNGVSHVPAVFELSLAIFLVLLTKFKQHLKMQIEVFFKEILLSMLETSLSSFQHKWLVIVCLAKITSNPQMVVDLYLNYDCDEYLANIFARMVDDISRVAQGRAASELGATAQQEHNIKVKGLESLVAIMRAMDDWTRPMLEELTARTVKDANSLQTEAHSDAVSLSSEAQRQADALDDEIAQFESRKQKKELLEAGIELFNKKPKKGMQVLQSKGFVGADPADVARFLLDETRLDRAAIGEYLGDGDQHCIDVMHKYVDLTDFTQTRDFLSCLRHFLGNFRLPGEAQKIDRIMEKFASRYCELYKDNGIFASADAAYVLAYSIIMLTTDLHSSKVKRKMTKEDFIKMTRGINENRDLPRDFVTSIYDDIAKQEIRLKGGTAAPRPAVEQLTNARTRQALYHEERRNIEASAEAAMTRAGTGKSSKRFLRATHVEHVRPMFKVVWTSLMAAFTIPLNSTNDQHVVDLCLEGLRLCIHIACIFSMDLERGAFVPALAKFTNLSSPHEIKGKNVDAIRCLLDVAAKEGDFLQDSWKDILACISQLELVQIVGAGKRARNAEAISQTASQDIVVATDRIFMLSRNLNGTAVVDFVRALCEVSMYELTHYNPPRKYTLTKTVEIAYYNMERVRIQWAHIWAVMGEHFNRVGCMQNQDVAFFAVDNLRQLSIKFLEKGELANYSFQKDFLRPFEYIMQHNKAVAIRDMVVRCVAQMVQSKANNIRSGWKNIFFVFSLAAADTDRNIVTMAFTTTKHIFDQYFSKRNDHRASLIAASFMDAVNCLTEFACNTHFPELSMEAIRQLRVCATTVADAPDLFVNPLEEDKGEPKIWVKGWFPVLFGLSRIITRCKMDVRTRALTVMFEVMKTYGETFLSQWWTDLFRVVFRIFDSKKLQDMTSQQERIEWMSTTCTHALRSIIDVVSQFFKTLEDCVIDDLFTLITWCIMQENEQLARAGTECLHILVMNNGADFEDTTWELAVRTISNLFDQTAPKELYEFAASPQQQLQQQQQLGAGVVEDAHDSGDLSGADKASVNGANGTAVAVAATTAATTAAVSSAVAGETGDSGTGSTDAGAAAANTAETDGGDGATAKAQHQRAEATEQKGAEEEREEKEAVAVADTPSSKESKKATPTKASPSKPSPKQQQQQQQQQQGRPRMTSKEQRSREKAHQQQLFNAIVIKSVVQLELIQTVEWIVLSSTKPSSQVVHNRTLKDVPLTPSKHQTDLTSARVAAQQLALSQPLDEAGEMFERLTSPRLLVLLDCLLRSHEFARKFNLNMELRTRLWKAGFMKNRSKPNLLKQETTALACALRILFRIYEAKNRADVHGDVEQRLLATCTSTFDHFLTAITKDTREVWTPLMCLLIRELLALPDAKFAVHGAAHYDALTECITLAFDSPLGNLGFLLGSFFQRTRNFQFNAPA